jgi:hypothetical protein
MISGAVLFIYYKILYQGFPTDGFNKPIDHFSDQLGTNFCAPNNSRVAVHACLPIAALLDHGRNRIRST